MWVFLLDSLFSTAFLLALFSLSAFSGGIFFCCRFQTFKLWTEKFLLMSFSSFCHHETRSTWSLLSPLSDLKVFFLWIVFWVFYPVFFSYFNLFCTLISRHGRWVFSGVERVFLRDKNSWTIDWQKFYHRPWEHDCNSREKCDESRRKVFDYLKKGLKSIFEERFKN